MDRTISTNIKQGKHNENLFSQIRNQYPWFHKGKGEFECIVYFNESMHYELDYNPEKDISKIFGVSFGILPVSYEGKLIAAHHYNSVRMGFRPAPKDSFDCFSYTYINGIREIIPLGRAVYSFKMTINSQFDNERVIRTYIDQGDCNILHRKFPEKKGYYLGPYIGGTKPAPYDTTINYEIEI